MPNETGNTADWSTRVMLPDFDTSEATVLLDRETTDSAEDRYFGELVAARRLRRTRVIPDEEVWRKLGM